MINENILSLFKSHKTDPSFSVIITDIQQKQECNQDILEITVNQVDTPIDDIIPNRNVFSRKLIVQSNLSLDDEDLYKTELIGYVSDEKQIAHKPSDPDILSRSIEILDTKLKNKISIEYNKAYEEKPKIILNIDEDADNLFRKYLINHITETNTRIINQEFEIEEEVNGEKVTKTEIRPVEVKNITYTGVEIEFIGLKQKYNYPIIGIIVIGDEEE